MGKRRSSRPLSDVDPRDFQDPAKRARKRRGPRNKPRPDDWQRRNEEDKLAFIRDRPINPGVLMEPSEEPGVWKPSAHHGDQRLWEVQLYAAFATSSRSVANQFLHDLKELCSQDWDDKHGWKVNETELNAALAMVNDIEPQTIREAALAAQMVAVHWLTMRLAKDALNGGGMVMERSAATLSKLARTYTMQMETLQRERGKGAAPVRQEINVKKETRIVYVDQRGRGGDENATRPQEARAETIEGCATMLGHSEGDGQALPSSSDAREARVSVPRREESRGEEGEG